jgi:cytoskeletal protein CcmA (bactofilin family)
MPWFGRNSRFKGASFENRPPVLGSLDPGHGAASEISGPDLVAHIFQGSRVTGQLTFHGATRIDGSFDGEILCHGPLTIGEGADVRAKVFGDVVVIHGNVQGDVTAKEKVELGAPAQLLGNIRSPRLVVAEGVVFDGDCAMAKAREKHETPAPQSSSIEAFEGGAPKLATVLKE